MAKTETARDSARISRFTIQTSEPGRSLDFLYALLGRGAQCEVSEQVKTWNAVFFFSFFFFFTRTEAGNNRSAFNPADPSLCLHSD